MGLRYELSPDYLADNGHTRLADITISPSVLRAPIDKIHPMPFPGLNIDNLPFFAVIAAQAEGATLIHDWVYDNRAIHLSDLTRLGADVRLLDPHRVLVNGPTRWSSAEVVCPPALRPAVCILLAMLAAKGTSVLRNVDIIARGYEHLYERLVEMGAAHRGLPRLTGGAVHGQTCPSLSEDPAGADDDARRGVAGQQVDRPRRVVHQQVGRAALPQPVADDSPSTRAADVVTRSTSTSSCGAERMSSRWAARNATSSRLCRPNG